MLEKILKSEQFADEEWPGFNLPLPAVAETLWDAEFDPNHFDVVSKD